MHLISVNTNNGQCDSGLVLQKSYKFQQSVNADLGSIEPLLEGTFLDNKNCKYGCKWNHSSVV